MNLQTLQSHAIQAALLSGKIIKEGMETRSWSVVGKKKETDFVTSVDYESETAITDYFREHCPDISILTEESGSSGGQQNFRWIIDPLDGTTNFLHGYPWVAVSIALEQCVENDYTGQKGGIGLFPPAIAGGNKRGVDSLPPYASRGEYKGGQGFPPCYCRGEHKGGQHGGTRSVASNTPQKTFGEPIIGVVYNPFTEDLFTAIEDNGAYHNDKPIHISNVQSLNDALLGTGYPFRDKGILDEYLMIFRELFASCHGIRRAGSAALDFSWLAAGAFDGFWEYGLSPWDMAAGAVLIREAGGIVTDFDGGDNWLETGNIVAGTPGVHPEILQVIQKIRSGQQPT